MLVDAGRGWRQLVAPGGSWGIDFGLFHRQATGRFHSFGIPRGAFVFHNLASDQVFIVWALTGPKPRHPRRQRGTAFPPH
jgi:hypothetical protein